MRHVYVVLFYFVEGGCSGKGDQKGDEETRATARD